MTKGSRVDIHRANRRMEMMFPSFYNRDIPSPSLPPDMKNSLNYCDNCQEGGNHECTGKACEILIIYDREKGEVRQERNEIPCKCEECNQKPPE
jgi:hypothetical protein